MGTCGEGEGKHFEGEKFKNLGGPLTHDKVTYDDNSRNGETGDGVKDEDEVSQVKVFEKGMVGWGPKEPPRAVMRGLGGQECPKASTTKEQRFTEQWTQEGR